MIARVGIGRAMIKGGEVERGLELLDEATASAVCGELRPHSTGLIYCITISSCQDLGDYRRAAEWTEEANSWCDRLEVTGFPGACRLHRAEAMRLRGDWAGAERQALAACDELQDFESCLTAGGYYEIGEIRRRQGNFAAAEEAYARANALGRDPQPGLSLLRLAQGKVDAASRPGIRRVARRDGRIRSRDSVTSPRRSTSRSPPAMSPSRSAAADELESIVDAYKIGGRRGARIRRRSISRAGDRARRRATRTQRSRSCAVPATTGRTWARPTRRRRHGSRWASRSGEPATSSGDGRDRGCAGRVRAARRAARRGPLPRPARQASTQSRTFLFTDIVGSTEAARDARARTSGSACSTRHNEIVRERIVSGGGEVIKNTGDGFFASFDDPKAGRRAAIAIQSALDDEIVAPDVRIGAHSGGRSARASGYTDYGGESVHLAARIGAAAGAAEILVSRESLDGVGEAFRPHGHGRSILKGFDEPVEVVSVDWR